MDDENEKWELEQAKKVSRDLVGEVVGTDGFKEWLINEWIGVSGREMLALWAKKKNKKKKGLGECGKGQHLH